MAFKFVFLFFTLALAAPALGYSTGAPEDACKDMIPQHHTDAQTSEPPYNIQVNRKDIRSGDEITVTIIGKTSADKIRGFMVQARKGNKRVGKFVVDPKDPFVQTLDCGNEPASAVTHKAHDEKDDKRSFTVTWVSPKDFKDEIEFRATVALNGGVFWVAIPSNKIKVH